MPTELKHRLEMFAQTALYIAVGLFLRIVTYFIISFGNKSLPLAYYCILKSNSPFKSTKIRVLWILVRQFPGADFKLSDVLLLPPNSQGK